MRIQKPKDKMWINETGLEIPVKYITNLTKLREKTAGDLAKYAIKLNQALQDFKMECMDKISEVHIKTMKEHDVKNINDKLNFTYYNFDRSICIKISSSDRIEFDGLIIEACKGKLDEFLSEEIDSKNSLIKQMVMDAFSNTKGKLDTNKVLNLLRYRSQIKHNKFHEALDLLESSIRKPGSKSYYQVSLKNTEGNFEPINLNFSSI